MTEILESIAMWAGAAGCTLALLTIFILVGVSSKINSTLNKDKILFDQNFALKKDVIEKAMALVDEIEKNGSSLASVPEYTKRVQECYNQLLCVSTDLNLVNQFLDLTMSGGIITAFDVAKFKVACRKDIGLSTKNFKLPKKAGITERNIVDSTPTARQRQPIPMQPPTPQPMQRPDLMSQMTNRPTQNAGVRQVARPVPQAPRTSDPIQNPVRTVTKQTLRKTDHQ